MDWIKGGTNVSEGDEEGRKEQRKEDRKGRREGEERNENGKRELRVQKFKNETQELLN